MSARRSRAAVPVRQSDTHGDPNRDAHRHFDGDAERDADGHSDCHDDGDADADGNGHADTGLRIRKRSVFPGLRGRRAERCCRLVCRYTFASAYRIVSRQ